ncbi:MAG TPA: hypothetical protein VGN08_13540 [Solirubrobacteraceae bacterium]
MSQENVKLVQRVLGHLVTTGEVLWDTADPEIEIHDHDTLDWSRSPDVQAGSTPGIRQWAGSVARWSWVRCRDLRAAIG